MIKKLLANWELETDKLAEAFAVKHFGKNSERWWVADEIGGVYYINDRFFNISDIADFVRFGYSADKICDYYDYALRIREAGGHPLNIKAYKHKL